MYIRRGGTAQRVCCRERDYENSIQSSCACRTARDVASSSAATVCLHNPFENHLRSPPRSCATSDFFTILYSCDIRLVYNNIRIFINRVRQWTGNRACIYVRTYVRHLMRKGFKGRHWQTRSRAPRHRAFIVPIFVFSIFFSSLHLPRLLLLRLFESEEYPIIIRACMTCVSEEPEPGDRYNNNQTAWTDYVYAAEWKSCRTI